VTMTADPQWRAVDAPFTTADEWDAIPGTCSRCRQPAALGERRWWHLGPPCRARRSDQLTQPVPADFIPTPTGGPHVEDR
jgi:hypothetical protein